MAKALVLAGGGVAGIAWMLGVLDGLGEPLAPDVIVGTSAGSAVGANLATGQLAAAIALQERAASAEMFASVDVGALLAKGAELSGGATDERETLRRYGAFALAAPTVAEAPRRAAVAARLPSPIWPAAPILKIAAVDAATGELVVFDRAAGVPLIDAVTASCAVPGVWPPATIGSRRYLDGGTRSFTNADLAAGCDRVLIVIPVADAPVHADRLARELATLGPAATHVLRVDDAGLAAIGPNPLDPARRAPALAAGRAFGRTHAAAIAGFWRGR